MGLAPTVCKGTMNVAKCLLILLCFSFLLAFAGGIELKDCIVIDGFEHAAAGAAVVAAGGGAACAAVVVAAAGELVSEAK